MNAPETFIATITDDGRTFEEDMELPSVMPISELCKHILMILKELHEGIFASWKTCCLMCNNRELKDNSNLLNAGVFDGSIIVVRER